jgi:hypothetical protein
MRADAPAEVEKGSHGVEKTAFTKVEASSPAVCDRLPGAFLFLTLVFATLIFRLALRNDEVGLTPPLFFVSGCSVFYEQ